MSSTGSVASPTKTSDTVRIGGRDLSFSLGVVGLGTLIASRWVL